VFVHDFIHGLSGDAVIENWPWVDVQGRAVVAPIAAGGCQQLDLAGQPGLGDSSLQPGPELLAATFAAIWAKAQVNTIS
jgi:hypothetical protein